MGINWMEEQDIVYDGWFRSNWRFGRCRFRCRRQRQMCIRDRMWQYDSVRKNFMKQVSLKCTC